MSVMRSSAVLSCCAFLCMAMVPSMALCAESAKAYQPAKVQRAPKIDGRLDDPCWNRTLVSKFVRIVGPDLDKKLHADAVARICCDSSSLFIAVEFMEPAIKELNKRFTGRDDPIWTDDCVEIFVAPRYWKPRRYFHFVVNPVNTQADQESAGMRGFDMGWNGSWTSAARILEDRWVVEIRIPWSDLGIEDAAKVNLVGCSICRERKAGEFEYSAWDVGGSFHRPSGHVILTSYEKFMAEDLAALWGKEKKGILALLQNGALKPAHRDSFSAIIKRTEDQITLSRKRPNAASANALCESIRTASEEAKALKRDAGFAVFIARLRNTVTK